MLRALLLALLATTANAQWQLLDTHSTADFRGVSSPGKGIVWISGTNGTILRSEDAGFLWQHCTTPPNAEHLDFRGIQAFDANTAIVMSSGKGDLSRLYKTTDGCQTWKLLFTNPDRAGFWDAFKFVAGDELVLLGDSVLGKRKLWECSPEDECSLHETLLSTPPVDGDESSFAASNSILELPVFPMSDANPKFDLRWASGNSKHAYVYLRDSCQCSSSANLRRVEVPIQTGSQSSGVFSLDFRNAKIGLAVGGDFQHPEQQEKNAAYSDDGGLKWFLSTTQPHGYRSSVAYDEPTKTWITVGPNGTDISTDDGRNWRALKPSPSDTPDADKNWNALALPYVVGPHGRVGLLEPAALKP